MAYVAMSRHRDRADLYHAREDFKDHAAMAARLSRDGAKDTVLDYLQRAAQPTGQPMPGGLRAALADAWERVKAAFGRTGDHPAEAQAKASDQREAARAAAQAKAQAAEQDRARAAAEAARQAAQRQAEEAERQRRAAMTPAQRMVEDLKKAQGGRGRPHDATAEALERLRAGQTEAARIAAAKLREELRAKAEREAAEAARKGRKPGSYDSGPGM
jgi:colicin import membrane protein